MLFLIFDISFQKIPSPSSTEEQVFPKKILYSCIAIGGSVFIGLIGSHYLLCAETPCVSFFITKRNLENSPRGKKKRALIG